SDDIAFIVLMAGTGLPGEELLVVQNAAMLRVDGADDRTIAAPSHVYERFKPSPAVMVIVPAGVDAAISVPGDSTISFLAGTVRPLTCPSASEGEESTRQEPTIAISSGFMVFPCKAFSHHERVFTLIVPL